MGGLTAMAAASAIRLITGRSQVQILPPQPKNQKSHVISMG